MYTPIGEIGFCARTEAATKQDKEKVKSFLNIVRNFENGFSV
jgi:hypothetical protein